MKWLIFILLIGTVLADPIDLNLATGSITGTTKIESKGAVNVIIGDESKSTFEPIIKLVRPNFEDANLTVKLKGLSALSTSTASVSNGVVTYTKDNTQIKMYRISQSVRDGGFEYEVILDRRPANDTVYFEIDSKNLDYFIQPLEPDVDSIMEENVKGSIAVFHKFKSNNKYGTGKVMHIYRPLIVDAIGKEVWGTFEISGNELRIVIPKDFLESAAYPLSVDPTFGYTNMGGTALDSATNANGHKLNSTAYYAATSGDRVISLHMAGNDSGTGAGVGLYNTTQGVSNIPNQRFASTERFSFTNTPTWYYGNVSYDLVVGQVYTTAIGNYSGSPKTYYDTVTNNSNSRSTTTGLSLVWAETGNTNRIFSIYATYINTASSFNPAFFVLSGNANNSLWTYPYNVTLYYRILGNASGYSAYWSLDGGTTNTSLSTVTNGTNSSIMLGELAAGNYGLWIFGVNGSISNSTFLNFSIGKNSTNNLGITLNPVSPITYGTSETITGTGCYSQLTCILYVENTSISQVSSPFSGVLAAAIYTIRYNTTGNTNYTALSTTTTLTVNKYTQYCSVSINGNIGNLTVEEGTETSALGSASNVSGDLYLDGVIKEVNPDVDTYANATYNYTYVSGGNVNYTSCWNTTFLFVNEASPFVAVFNITVYSPINNTAYAYGTEIILNVSAAGNATGYEFDYELDGGALTGIGTANNATPINISLGTGLASGPHSIIVYGYNGTVTVESYINFSINAAPAGTFTPAFFVYPVSPANNSLISQFATVGLNFSVFGNATGYTTKYSLDGAANVSLGALANGTFSITNLGWLSIGNHNLRVFGANGSVENYTYLNFSVQDITAPAINFTSPLNQSYEQCTGLSLSIGANETLSSQWYRLNQTGANITFTNPTTLSLVNGSFLIEVWANDSYGNIGFNSSYFTYNLTACAPPVAGNGSYIIMVVPMPSNDYKLLVILILVIVAALLLK